MPRYHTTVQRWISHECRMVGTGEFETTFPKVKTADGEVDMKLGATLTLLPDEEPEKGADKGAKGGKKGAKVDDPLV